MNVLFSVDPRKAVNRLKTPEATLKELRKTLGQFKRKSDGGNRATDRIMANLKENISDSVAEVVVNIYDELVFSTPRDSIWLAHNWDHSSGAYPAVTLIPTPARGPYKRGPMFDEPPELNPGRIDGLQVQYIYNTAEYASEYIGDGSSEEADAIIARFENGSYLRQALKRNGWTSR